MSEGVLVIFYKMKTVEGLRYSADPQCISRKSYNHMYFSTKVCNIKFLIRHICKFCLKYQAVSSDLSETGERIQLKFLNSYEL